MWMFARARMCSSVRRAYSTRYHLNDCDAFESEYGYRLFKEQTRTIGEMYLLSSAGCIGHWKFTTMIYDHHTIWLASIDAGMIVRLWLFHVKQQCSVIVLDQLAMRCSWMKFYLECAIYGRQFVSFWQQFSHVCWTNALFADLMGHFVVLPFKIDLLALEGCAVSFKLILLWAI